MHVVREVLAKKKDLRRCAKVNESIFKKLTNSRLGAFLFYVNLASLGYLV